MTTRKEMKIRAKQSLRKNYWTAVIACFLLALFCNEHGSSVAGLTAANGSEVDYDELDSYSYEVENSDNYSVVTDIAGFDDDEEDGGGESKLETAASNAFNDFTKERNAIFSAIGSVAATIEGSWIEAFILAVAAAGSIAFIAFVSWPILIGGQRCYLDMCEGIEGLKARVILCIYRRGILWNTTKVMFFKWLKGGLWWLTIIGGVIKYYEYRMIPFLLAENPHIKSKEAFRLAGDMMKGNKWRLFVLDLSFAGWYLLTVATFGLAGIFFAAPYQSLTTAQFYQAVRDGAALRNPELYKIITESTF